MANLIFSAGVAQYLRDEESIDAIESPTIVTVVTDENEDDTTIAHLTAEDSVHFITSPRLNIAVWSPVRVNVVFAVLVPVTQVQSEEPDEVTVQDLSAERS